ASSSASSPPAPLAAAAAISKTQASSLAPPRASGDEAPENSAVAVHHPDALVAEPGDEDAAEVLAAAPLADEAVGGVPVDVALGKDGEAGVTEGGGEFEDCGGSAAGEGDAGVAGCEAGVGGGGGVATDVGHGVGGDAHLAGSVVLNVSNLLKALKVFEVSKVLLC
ncbi:hypothetical protein V502_10160, partial [Pseudogymnoascus sp. VKM F-4520 (FW-2644)]